MTDLLRRTNVCAECEEWRDSGTEDGKGICCLRERLPYERLLAEIARLREALEILKVERRYGDDCELCGAPIGFELLGMEPTKHEPDCPTRIAREAMDGEVKMKYKVGDMVTVATIISSYDSDLEYNKRYIGRVGIVTETHRIASRWPYTVTLQQDLSWPEELYFFAEEELSHV